MHSIHSGGEREVREKWMTFQTISFSSRFNSIKSLLISIKSNTWSGFQTMDRSIIHLYVCSFASLFTTSLYFGRLFIRRMNGHCCWNGSDYGVIWMSCGVKLKTMHRTTGNLIQIDRNWIIFHSHIYSLPTATTDNNYLELRLLIRGFSRISNQSSFQLENRWCSKFSPNWSLWFLMSESRICGFRCNILLCYNLNRVFLCFACKNPIKKYRIRRPRSQKSDFNDENTRNERFCSLWFHLNFTTIMDIKCASSDTQTHTHRIYGKRENVLAGSGGKFETFLQIPQISTHFQEIYELKNLYLFY